MDPAVLRAATWAGISFTPAMVDALDAYARWLRREAIVAGGLGPQEADRIEARHIADSLCLAQPWAGMPPDRLVDVGSGVGLPGIPLAITHPRTQVTLIERSGRRCRLLSRALRVLEQRNVEVRQVDATQVEEQWPVVVARASIPPSRPEVYQRLVAPGGLVVLAGSRVAPATAIGFTTVEIPVEVLDSPAWILTMAQP